jgi:acyl-[acyl carrier protein]--UDP-N-acetylglucosamine O-acyltransferase
MKTYILGNSGFAREIFEQIFLRSHSSNFGGFIILKDDKPFVIDSDGSYEFMYPIASSFVLGTGNKKWRKTFIDHFKQHYRLTSAHFPTFCAEDAHISKMSVLGIGNVFCSFSLTNANAEVGDFNCFNIYSTVSHDCVVKDHNIISPYAGIMGYCKVGSHNFLGTHSTITPKLTIGDDNTISAGECLFDDLADRQFFQSGVVYNKP